ncbi:MAG: hypothetical protein ACYDAN_05715 [Candidatus Limnocylindrales bacterium]
MPRPAPSDREPVWLSPALVLLAVLAFGCAMLAWPVAFLVLPVLGILGWRLRGLGFRAAASWAVPVGLVIGALSLLPVPSWALGLALLACGAGSAWMLVDRTAVLWWLSVLPAGWRGEPWALRVEVEAFSDASQRGNALFRRINGGGTTAANRRDLAALRADAARERDRSGVWRGAWDAFIEQLDTISECLDADDPASFTSALDDRSSAVRDAIHAAAEETRRRDPFGVWIEQPGVGMIEDTQGRPVGASSDRSGA